MISFLHSRIRIGIVLILAFFLSGLLMRYAIGETETVPPTIEIKTIANDFALSLSNTGTSILASLQSIKVPQMNPEPTPANQQPEEPSPPAQEPTQEWTTEPTTPPQPPTSTPTQAFPTIGTIPTSYPNPTYGTQPTIAPQPTAAPKPTKVPAPTKVPKPTAVVFPPVNSDTRPGGNIQEIIEEAGKRACVPPALIMAIKTIETGERFKNESAASIKIYNTYGWWTTGAGNPCYGYGYHTQTGIVPADSVSAGTSCSRAVGSPTDIGIMGLMQVSQEEETVTRKYTSKFLPKNIDRRVLFDNVLIFAIATKNRVGTISTKSCTDWDDDTVKLAAEKHHGVCVYDYGTGNAGNYCTKVLSLYKSFK